MLSNLGFRKEMSVLHTPRRRNTYFSSHDRICSFAETRNHQMLRILVFFTLEHPKRKLWSVKCIRGKFVQCFPLFTLYFPPAATYCWHNCGDLAVRAGVETRPSWPLTGGASTVEAWWRWCEISSCKKYAETLSVLDEF
jgi:hypothetical protein